jgi:hypothetical protein
MQIYTSYRLVKENDGARLVILDTDHSNVSIPINILDNMKALSINLKKLIPLSSELY